MQLNLAMGVTPAESLVSGHSVVVEQKERQDIITVARHQQLEALIPDRMPRGVGDGALKLAMRAEIHSACKPSTLGDDFSFASMHSLPG